MILLAIFIVSSLSALTILVIERLDHPPKNGHYRDMESPYER